MGQKWVVKTLGIANSESMMTCIYFLEIGD